MNQDIPFRANDGMMNNNADSLSSDITSKNESPSSSSSGGNTKYVLAAIIFGAAVGNIFFAKKMKGIKINFYKKSERVNVHGNNFNRETNGKNRVHSKPIDEDEYRMLEALEEISGELSMLSLPQDKLPSAIEVKEAYRRLVLLHHPDRNRDNKLGRKSSEIFNRATEAKDKLLQSIAK